MEPLGSDVRRELSRFGPQGGMAELLERWPASVGPEIARNAWPARVARDGTVHVHAADAVWAFELGQRASEIATRLGVRSVRFAPGPLPEPATEPVSPRAPTAAEPSEEERRQAAALAATVEDEELRERIARAAALSLARARSVGSF